MLTKKFALLWYYGKGVAVPRNIQFQSECLYETLSVDLDRFVTEQRFFSIRQLMQRYQASRRVVEKTLAKLEEEKQIRIAPAKGIFVLERKRNTRIITLVHYDWSAEYLRKFDAAIEKEVKQHPDWLFSRAFFKPDSELRFIEFLREIHGDAILLILPFRRFTQTEIAELLSLPTPVIFLGSDILCDGVNTVDTYPEGAGMSAAECLIRNGHRKIALLLTEPQSAGSWRRNDAFLTYARLRGLEPQIIDCEVHRGEGSCAKTHDSMVKYFRRYGVTFTGCFATSDYSAFGVVSACRECDILVPEKVSIIGAGDIESADHFDPPLSTIADDMPGSICAIRAGLTELFNGGRFGIRSVPSFLIERKSVANIR